MSARHAFTAHLEASSADAVVLRMLLAKLLATHGEMAVREIVKDEVRIWCLATKMPPPEVEWTPHDPRVAHVWCEQCDRLVRTAEAERCRAPFCKGKEPTA